MVLQWLTTRSNTTCTHEMPALFMRFTVSAYMQVCIWLCCWENVSKTVEEKHRQTGGAGIFVYISKWLCVCHTTIYAACVHHILSNGRNFRICTLVATVYQRGKGKTTLYDDPSFALEQKHSMEFHQLYQTFNSFWILHEYRTGNGNLHWSPYGHIQHFYILLHGLCIQFMGSGGENIVLVTRLVTSLDTLHSGFSYREKEKEGKSSQRNNGEIWRVTHCDSRESKRWQII